MPRSLFILATIILTILTLASTRPEHHYTIGQVLDDRSEPIAGARVRQIGSPMFTITDAEGRFRLPLERTSHPRLTAWKRGYLIGAADGDVIPLTKLPDSDCDRYEWIAPTPNRQRPAQCGNCHAEIYREWASTGHAHSSQSPRFLAALTDVEAHLPDGASVCLSCHAPTISPLADVRQAPAELAGVHCDYCHKVVGWEDRAVGTTHGRYLLRTLRPDPEREPHQLFFGPLEDVARGEDSYSPFMRDSRFCAACHEGIVFGVHAYSTYSEWLASPARERGQSCQSCHMAPTGRMTNIAPGHGGFERNPLTLGRHFHFAPDRLTMLREAISIDFHAMPNKQRLEIHITARNVGHRIPTGFPDRALLIRVHREGEPIVEYRLGKHLIDRDTGKADVPFWRADPAFIDDRLQPEKPSVFSVPLPSTGTMVRVEILEQRHQGAPEPTPIMQRYWSYRADTKFPLVRP